jgi:hypothetical protein
MRVAIDSHQFSITTGGSGEARGSEERRLPSSYRLPNSVVHTYAHISARELRSLRDAS